MQRLFQQALSAIGFGGSPGPDCRKEVPEAAALKGCVAAGGMALGLGSLSPGGARTAVDDFSTHPPSPCGDEAEGSDLEVQVGEAVEEVEVVRTLRVYSSRSPQEDLRQSLASADSDAVAASAEREKEEAASSRDVQIMRVFRNPDVLVAPSLVADSLCSHLLNVASNRWEPSKTSVGLSSADQVTFLSAGGEMDALQGGDCVAAAASLRQALVRVSVCAQSAYKSGKSPSRTSKSAMLKDGETPGVSSVELLACSLARMPLQHLEPLVVVRYDPGEYFNEHHDGAFRPVTVLLYLNDVESGGQTYFPALGLKISPMRGCGVCWNNLTSRNEMDMRTLHSGLPPTKGTKFAVNCFFNKQPVRFLHPPRELPPSSTTDDEDQHAALC